MEDLAEIKGQVRLLASASPDDRLQRNLTLREERSQKQSSCVCRPHPDKS